MDLAAFTAVTWIGATLALAASLGIICVGVFYLVAPEVISRGFGFRDATAPEALPWQHVKGPRDIVSGLVGIVSLVLFGPTVAAVVILVETIIPVGDALTILQHRGSLSAVLGIHLSTAIGMVVTATLLLA